jgi:hypothetical protein
MSAVVCLCQNCRNLQTSCAIFPFISSGFGRKGEEAFVGSCGRWEGEERERILYKVNPEVQELWPVEEFFPKES